MLRNLLFFLIFLAHPLLSTSITFLPGKIEGSLPNSFQRIGDRSQEISKFGAFYANLLLRAKVETTERIKDKEIFEKFKSSHFGKEDFLKLCSELSVDYLVRDELHFQNQVSLDRSVYNCTQKQFDELHLTEKSDLFSLMRSMTEKSFPWIPSKKRQIAEISQKKTSKELIFVVDLSPSFQREREEWVQFVKNASWESMTGLRVATFSEGKTTVLPKATSLSELKTQISNLRSVGKSSLDDLSNALIQVKRNLLSTGAKSQTIQDIIILTNAKGKIPNPTLSSILQDLESNGYGIRLFTAPYFSISQTQYYKGILPKESFFEITYSRKVSTAKDSKTLIFRGRQIYFTFSELAPGKIGSEASLNKVSYSGKYTESESINPLNFTEIYSELTGDKILASEPLQDNLAYLLSNVLLKGEYKSEGPAILVKSGERAFWISLPKGVKIPEQEETVSYQTTYVPSGASVDGVTNVADLTEVYRGSPSQILECTPVQVRNYFQNTNKSSFDCIVRGRVLQVKGL
ncbi:LIC10012 family protein [Leptospira stimsonii]|uniref:VWA domain-containing protein n=1 Tax=Leptospira stimsonii TaxID=2202203 RepID=A0ABY2NA52_9LEPT|nr:VWA domain-containing protein [Leptospira stimsonii]TGK11114.1 VWA domain-containing protein [Leptospira stimsonii]TGM19100.1 VWA domain-containing protein [Leptospira stimsonii]